MRLQTVIFTSFILVLSACAQNDAQKPRAITPPSTLPPDGFIGNEWIDSRGCRYLKLTNPSGKVDWVASVTLKGSHICDGNPISGGTPNAPKTNETQINTINQAAQPNIPTPSTGDAPDAAVSVNSPQPQVRSDDQFFSGSHWMQVGAFSILSNAEKTVERLKGFQYDSVILYGDKLNIVYVRSRKGQSAEQFEKEIKAIGYDGFFVSAAQ